VAEPHFLFTEGDGLVTILKILAFILIVAGAVMVYGAQWAVRKYGLDRNIKCGFEDQMEEEEILQYKFNRAIVNFKMQGMLVALPGLILLLVLFR